MNMTLRAAVLALGLVGGGQTFAADWYLNLAPANASTSPAFTTGQEPVIIPVATNGSSTNPDAPGVQVSGFKNSTTDNTTTIAQSTIQWFSGNGWGIGGEATPEHSIDNVGGYEMMLLDFTPSSKKVSLTSLTVGWNGTQNYCTTTNNVTTCSGSDMTVLAYTGAGTPTSLVGKNWTSLLSSGWTLIGNYTKVLNGNSTTYSQAINAASVSSSYWLIGAYNPLAANGSTTYGSTGGTAPVDTTSKAANSTNFVAPTNTATSYSDYIKLNAVTGVTTSTTNKVPEPGTLGLMLGALAFATMARRRRA
jgi:hypothetical protein